MKKEHQEVQRRKEESLTKQKGKREKIKTNYNL